MFSLHRCIVRMNEFMTNRYIIKCHIIHSAIFSDGCVPFIPSSCHELITVQNINCKPKWRSVKIQQKGWTRNPSDLAFDIFSPSSPHGLKSLLHSGFCLLHISNFSFGFAWWKFVIARKSTNCCNFVEWFTKNWNLCDYVAAEHWIEISWMKWKLFKNWDIWKRYESG